MNELKDFIKDGLNHGCNLFNFGNLDYKYILNSLKGFGDYDITLDRKEKFIEEPSNWGIGYKISGLSTTVITFRKKQ